MVARAPLSRRALLGTGAALALGACGGRTPAGPGRVRYATDHPDQYAVLGLPDASPTGLVVLLHGGFWRADYGADLMDPVAADLQGRGLATWNVEYRRLGDGGGWPATFDDVALAVDHVRLLGPAAGLPVVLVGHSAGGHLAAWAASRTAHTPGGEPRVRPAATVSLSGVLDLASAQVQSVGGDAVAALMGATAAEAPRRYDDADPVRLVPARSPVTAVHAVDDRVVPLDQSRRYVEVALAAGGAAGLVTVPGDHFALIDPGSPAWQRACTAIEAGTVPPRRP